MSDSSSQFLITLASHLAKDPSFTERVARHVAGALSSTRAPAAAAAPAASAPAKRGPGRPRKNASAPAAAAPPAKRGPGRPPGPAAGGEGSVTRVLAAIRGGAATKKEITSKARVSSPAYSYSVKTLREKGLIRVVGTRSAAKILAV